MKKEFPYKYNAEQAIRDGKLKAHAVVPIIDGSNIRAWAVMPADEAKPVLDAVRAALGPMKIELRKVHFAEFNSEETSCFNAEIWINGTKAGTCRNEGHGGPTDVNPHALSAKLDAYGATLPLTVSSIADEDDATGFFTYQPDAEHICDDLFEVWLRAEDAKKERRKFERDMQSRFLFTKNGKPGIFQSKKLDAPRMNDLRRRPRDELAKAWDAKEILNFMPTDQAFAVYQQNIARA